MSTWHLTRGVTVVKRRPKLDEDGTPVEDDYGNAMHETTEVELGGCDWEPRQSLFSENVEARQQTVDGLTLTCDDPAADISAVDELIVDGVRYQVDSEVGRFTGSGDLDHAVVVLKRVNG